MGEERDQELREKGGLVPSSVRVLTPDEIAKQESLKQQQLQNKQNLDKAVEEQQQILQQQQLQQQQAKARSSDEIRDILTGISAMLLVATAATRHVPWQQLSAKELPKELAELDEKQKGLISGPAALLLTKIDELLKSEEKLTEKNLQEVVQLASKIIPNLENAPKSDAKKEESDPVLDALRTIATLSPEPPRPGAKAEEKEDEGFDFTAVIGKFVDGLVELFSEQKTPDEVAKQWQEQDVKLQEAAKAKLAIAKELLPAAAQGVLSNLANVKPGEDASQAFAAIGTLFNQERREMVLQKEAAATTIATKEEEQEQAKKALIH